MTTAAIDKCIFWQEYVLRNSTNPEQKARCQAAIERLKQEQNKIAPTA